MAGAHGLRSFGRILRNTFAREALEAEPEAPPRAPRARSLVRALLAIEELPVDPDEAPRVRARDRRRAFAALDVLPLDPVEPPGARRGPGIWRALLVPERLSEEPVEPRPASRLRWLSWLLRPESLDPPQMR